MFLQVWFLVFVFFKQKTAYEMRISDWSSDVCSSDLLGQAVDLAIAHLQHPARVLQHGPRLQLSEGDDLRHMVRAIFLLDVADHLPPPRFAEVDVEIRHGDAFRV